ncbi:MAG: hypothetical protein QF733_08920 [Phycisphaerales bacterium]|nr:hypothetical protein [Phycisphaerales bacterium]
MHRLCVRICLAWSAGVALAGCSTLKGGGLLPSAAGTASPITWESTAASPKTIVLVDVRTGENIFEMDIPLGKQLSVQFFQVKDPQKHPKAPDTMFYGLQPAGQWVGVLDETVAVPHAVNRRIDVFLRTPEPFTPPDPARPVVAYEVPRPDDAGAVTSESAEPAPAAQPDSPSGQGPAEATSATAEAAADSDAAAEGAADAPAAAPSAAPESSPAPDTPVDAAPASGPEPDAGAEVPADAASEPAAASDPPVTSPPVTPVASARRAAMTWTDSGHARRVSVSDMRTGADVFEVDVPGGHDLVLHFYEMWTPPGADKDVEAMHWQIVPAGAVVAVPAHHATVPSEAHRRVTEREVYAGRAADPQAPAPQAAPDPAPDDEAPAPPPVDLLEDDPTPS